MTTESNKAIVRRYREIHNTDQLNKLGEVLAENFTPHTLLPDMEPRLETYSQIHQMARASFPDLMVTTEDLIAEGDKVVERWTLTQTHTGELFMDAPASGKRVQVTGISIYRIADDRIVEHWANMDLLGVLQQLGLAPA